MGTTPSQIGPQCPTHDASNAVGRSDAVKTTPPVTTGAAHGYGELRGAFGPTNTAAQPEVGQVARAGYATRRSPASQTLPAATTGSLTVLVEATDVRHRGEHVRPPAQSVA